MKRRTFLLAGLGAGGALFVGWSFVPPRQRLYASGGPARADKAIALNGWVVVSPDDTITVVVPKAEMGQGIHTALAMLVAEEMDCAWERVRVEQSPIDAIYNNLSAISEGLPFHPDDDNALVRGVKWMTDKTMREFGIMLTGGSSSVRDCWQPVREAGASARASLIAAAAARTGMTVAECRTERGVVICGDTRFTFGELAADALHHRPSRVTLKDASAYTLLGRNTPRLDSAAKSNGTAQFGIDVARPDMRFAAVAMSPAFGGDVATMNTDAAQRMPGVRAVIRLPGSSYGDAKGVAVVADSWWRARKGLDALAITWTAGPHATLSTADVMQQLRRAAGTTDGFSFRSIGDAPAAFGVATRKLTATYEAPYLAHNTMEPMNATVLVTDDAAEVWTGTQVPSFARKCIADITGVSEDRVTLHQTLLGGGFGRRLDVDYVAQAAYVGKMMPGVSVKLLWSREEDMRHDFYRPAAVSQLSAGLDAKGALTAFIAHSASQAPFKSYARRVGFAAASNGPDRTTSEGTWDQPYEFATLRSSHAEVELPVPVGSWRAVGHSHQAFFVESFLDEVAHAAGTDPVAMRESLLQKHPRALAVLRLAAEKSGWGTPLAPASDGQPCARGVAMHMSFGTTTAQVLELSLSPQGFIRVHRVVCAVDCGFPVNPNIVTQQVESAIIDGISAALHGEITLDKGAVKQGNFNSYTSLGISAAPRIETHIIPSMEVPSGIGEPALPPVAPAMANALFALTKQRVRVLPLRLPDATITGATS